MPHRATPEQRSVGTGHAVVGNTNVVLGTATYVNDGPFDRKARPFQRSVAQDFNGCERPTVRLTGHGLAEWRHNLEAEFMLPNSDHVTLTKLL